MRSAKTRLINANIRFDIYASIITALKKLVVSVLHVFENLVTLNCE